MAADLLTACAFVAADEIPYSLLQEWVFSWLGFQEQRWLYEVWLRVHRVRVIRLGQVGDTFRAICASSGIPVLVKMSRRQ